MKTYVALLISALLTTAHAGEKREKTNEWIGHLSPDKKFGVRILTENEHPPGSEIRNDDVRDIQLVALPSRALVAHLPEDSSRTPYESDTFLWSPDSQRFAFGQARIA